MTNDQINSIWNNLPGLSIHNEAAASGISTAYALRIAFAKAILAAAPAQVETPQELGHTLEKRMDKEYELIQNGEQVAATSGVNAFNEIKHYVWQYNKDGPVEVFEVTRRKIDLSAAPQVVADEWARHIKNMRHLVECISAGGSVYNNLAESASVALAALQAAPVQPVAVPDSWKLVPVEPDCMMAHAVLLDSRSNDSYLGSEPRELWIADRVYRTMLAAAPAAPAAQGDSTEPKLPSIPLAKMLTGKDSESLQVWYSKEQMQEYALAAIAAKAAS